MCVNVNQPYTMWHHTLCEFSWLYRYVYSKAWHLNCQYWLELIKEEKMRRKNWQQLHTAVVAAAKANKIGSIKQLQLVRSGDFCSLLWATRAQSTNLLHWSFCIFARLVNAFVCLCIRGKEVFCFSFMKYVIIFIEMIQCLWEKIVFDWNQKMYLSEWFSFMW